MNVRISPDQFLAELEDQNILSEIAVKKLMQRIIKTSKIETTTAFLCRDEPLRLTMDNFQITGGALRQHPIKAKT